ncbi:MAG: 3-phosphoshikimate 1-carboxyvinyltransferase [Bacteroidota bacterium]|nr:3-phosphoshikimate 1-carboxyvinyltransferase [Bacteroidota bacterium]
MTPDILTISAPQVPIRTEISLPASKSIANRLLIMQSFNPAMKIDNLSDANDTVLLQRLIQKMHRSEKTNNPVKIDAGPAGTVYRFMAARLAMETGEWFLTGSERMKQRPVKLLVDALRTLGADIEYTGNEDYPPLIIHGHQLKGGTVSIDGGVSSQYISALLMIGPLLEDGLDLTLTGNIGSLPYIQMTVKLMQQAGIEVINQKNNYCIPPQSYSAAHLITEPDWSAASYWFQIVSMSRDAEVMLKDLKPGSLQGDSAVRALFETLGVASHYTEKGGLFLRSIATTATRFTADFTAIPDLAQTFAVTLAAKGIPSRLTGLRSLRIKETDRITALIRELDACGLKATEKEDFVLELPSQQINTNLEIPFIHTWHDHRMAMAFAPICLTGLSLQIEDPDVVQKSYPAYWHHLNDAGFLTRIITIR